MKGIAFLPGFIGALLTLGIILPATAQVTSDGTTNTTVNSTGNNFNILNGIQRGNNLFHSFKEFSIPTGGSATFQNSSAIENIINRVTGGNISNIDGLIKSQGSANLFLINPAGIVFGENASLDIGGSFLGTTAESILFEDGFEFSAVNAESEPLLTISVPLGLQMGSNSGSITVQGNGHAITGGLFFPFNFNDTATGLQVSQGKTLGLISNGINLTGGIIRVPGGNIQLMSIAQGILNLDNSSQAWQFDSSQVQNFGDINLLDKALLDTSGVFTGDIELQGRNITLEDASTIAIQNLGTQPSGDIIINATETIQIAGSLRNAPDQVTPLGTITGVAISRLTTENLGIGKAGNIIIDSGNLFVKDGALITSRSYSEGSSGNIDINVNQLIETDGFSSLNPVSGSIIATTIFSNGDTGNMNISAQNMNILGGGAISLTSFGSGQGGEVLVNVAEHTTISGFNQITFAPSSISSTAFRKGNSGDLTINTAKLSILSGGALNTSTLAEGSAGKLTVNASESINISGAELQQRIASYIGSGAEFVGEIFRQAFGLPDLASGDSGSLVINTPSLMVTDAAGIGVSNQGLGNSGDLQINTNQIFLDSSGNITAFSATGQGGNIELNVEDSLLLRNSSSISTEAKGTGNGGNININSPIIAGFEDSDIIANAVDGNGGNINITTQGIFGLELRDELTEESDITASSESGVNGTIKINNVGIDPSSGLVELPTLKDSSQQIAADCSSNNESSFVATGRGGMPQNPNEYLNLNRTWSDVRDLSAFYKQNNHTVENRRISNKPAIVEATGLIRNANGVIEFVVLENTPFKTKKVAECSGINT